MPQRRKQNEEKVTFEVDFQPRKPDKELDVNWRTVVISVVVSLITVSVIGLLVLLSAVDTQRKDSIQRSENNCKLTRESREEGARRLEYSTIIKDIFSDPRVDIPLEYRKRVLDLPPLSELKPPNCDKVSVK